VRLQVALPAQIDLGGLSAQHAWPIRLQCVDRAASVAAQLRGETEHHEFLLPFFGRLPRVMHNGPPAFVGNMVIDEFLYFLLALLRRGTARFFAVPRLPALKIRDQPPEVFD
jgi:hypothetical protein